MPLFRYRCPKCQTEIQKLTNKSQYRLPCECGGELEKQLPSEVSSQTLEMRDPHRGVQLPKNHESRMKERYNSHHDKYELAKKIDDHGIEDAKRYGWLKRIKKN